jgi:hypothetical protein
MKRRDFLPLNLLGALLPAAAWMRWSGIASMAAKAGKLDIVLNDPDASVGGGDPNGNVPIVVFSTITAAIAVRPRRIFNTSSRLMERYAWSTRTDRSWPLRRSMALNS